MNAKFLRAILENIHDDVDIYVNVDGYDVDVGGTFINGEQGYLALIPINEQDADEEIEDECGAEEGGSDMCELPEFAPVTTKIRDL